MKQSRGIDDLLIIAGTVLFIISIFLPWITTLFGSVPGYDFRFYIVLIPIAYPLYTAIRNTQIHRKIGYFCAMIPIAVLIILFFNFSTKSEELNIQVSKASFGLYIAILSTILILIGVMIKIKKQNNAE